MKTVFCVGEALIDFVAENQGSDLTKAMVFTKKPGGAPANVACAIAKLGGTAKFIGSVGRDAFGSYLIEVLEETGVDLSWVQRKRAFTTLAFVSLAEDGERDFVFSRGADRKLRYDRGLRKRLNGNILHLGAATALLGGKLEDAYSRYLFDALTQETFISFDPNFRGDLWKGAEAIFIKKCRPYLERAHLCKFSEEEARLLSGKRDLESGCAVLHAMGVRVIAITRGREGTLLSTAEEQVHVPSIPVQAVDTTGAGDAFIGCLLQQIAELDQPLAILDRPAQLTGMIEVANRAGALTTTGYGAIPSLPTRTQLYA